MYKTAIIIITTLLLLCPIQPAFAQDEPDGPIYIIQPGDTLFEIANRFGVGINEIIMVNTLEDPNALAVGDQITIPGYEGISGILEIRTSQLGEDFSSITRTEHLSPSDLSRLNDLSSPTEVYAGRSLIVPSSDDKLRLINDPGIGERPLIASAANLKINPWTFLLNNHKDHSWQFSGDGFAYGNEQNPEVEASEKDRPFFISVSPLPLVQGKTITITVDQATLGDYSIKLDDQELRFFPSGNHWIARIGIPAMETPGLISFDYSEMTPDNHQRTYSQMVLIEAANYINETVSGVQTLTIDPKIIEEEDAILETIISSIPDKLWDGPFNFPVDEPCVGSGFGNRRSYNDGAYLYYHTGLDFTICSANNLNIYAPAPGVVAFTGQLPIKGNFTVIDHGQGIMTGYAHQSEVMVNIGDRVETGQLIGVIGNTGRSVGPHLHWEVWVNGIYVDPYDWTQNDYE
ncbi:MAG: peptidoglycan DD-metalloendopeptidase family protein [Anaerolineae bacterium]|jgi:murein DD-endopeptidase MepM/ murein hydrolase activator NlpD|nr:peptidoglycan DD-metalloendopeptidase family protein [Anaerolineae bacterium]